MDGLEECAVEEPVQVAPGVLVLSRPGAAAAGGSGWVAPGPGAGPRRGRSRLRGAVPRIGMALAAGAVVLGAAVGVGRTTVGPAAGADSLWSSPELDGTTGAAVASLQPIPSASAAPSSAAPSSAAPWAGVDAVDWVLVMTQLDAARSAALVSLDASLLVGYAATGSAALAEGERLIAQLEERGLRPVGWATAIVSAEPEEASAGSIVLRVADDRGSYALVDRSGAVADRIPASGTRTWRVTLQQAAAAPPPGDPGWRVVSVAAVP